jgi:hypothetical protein
MKTKFLPLAMTALAVITLVGCQRHAADNSPAPANTMGDQQTSNSTNSSNAENPAITTNWNNTNNPAITNWSGTNNPTATNQ